VRPRAKAEAMLSDMIHFRVAITKYTGEEVYESRDEHRTARVDDISDVQSDAWVSITRTVVDTEEGRNVAARFKR